MTHTLRAAAAMLSKSNSLSTLTRQPCSAASSSSQGSLPLPFRMVRLGSKPAAATHTIHLARHAQMLSISTCCWCRGSRLPPTGLPAPYNCRLSLPLLRTQAAALMWLRVLVLLGAAVGNVLVSAALCAYHWCLNGTSCHFAGNAAAVARSP